MKNNLRVINSYTLFFFSFVLTNVLYNVTKIQNYVLDYQPINSYNGSS